MFLDHNKFFIKEQVAVLKLTDTYDIFDPDTERQIATAREEPGSLVTYSRLLLNKKLLPTTINIRDKEDNSIIFSIRRGMALFSTKVEVFDADNKRVGYFQSKIFTLSPSFTVLTDDGEKFAEIKGKIFGTDFTFLGQGDKPIGVVKKKWQGIAKALFTSANNFLVEVDASMHERPVAKLLLVAAALAIDMVFYEKK